MDAFFASIEERDNPRLRGRPIVVGADPKGGVGRGVVSTANYAARKYGIRSALPISTAWRYAEEARRKGLPAVAFLSVNMEKYVEVSRRIMEIVRHYSPHIEQASVDEAYFDLAEAVQKEFLTDQENPAALFSNSRELENKAADFYELARRVAEEIKTEIKEKENLTASVGIGPNKLIAKIASDRQKPDGLTVVREEAAEKFLEPLPIRVIPGVGPKTEERFRKLGVRTVGDAKKFSAEELHEMLGSKWGSELYDKLRGRDESPLIEEWEAKSVGEQATFERDTHDAPFLRKELMALADGVFARFHEGGFKSFRGVTITVRFADFATKTRSTTLEKPVASLAELQFAALWLFMPFLDRRENPERKAFRLLGVRLEKLK